MIKYKTYRWRKSFSLERKEESIVKHLLLWSVAKYCQCRFSFESHHVKSTSIPYYYILTFLKTKSRLKQDKLQIHRFSSCTKGISFNKQPGKCGSDSNTTDLVSPWKRYNLGVSNNKKIPTFTERSIDGEPRSPKCSLSKLI